MTSHTVGTRETWLKARLALLEAEKELTRRSDALAKQRQALPWVRVDKAYRFETEDGPRSLVDLFAGRSQLLVYHFMFGPDYVAGCPVRGHLWHRRGYLHARSTGSKHVRTRRQRGLSRVLHLCAWTGCGVGYVSVA